MRRLLLFALLVVLAPAAPAAGEDAVTRLAESLTQSKHYLEAAREYERILAARPDDVEAKAHLAQLSAWLGDYDRAIVLYREAIAAASHSPGLKSDLADVLRWSHRYDEAARMYRQALDEAPDHHEALKGLAEVQLYTGDSAGADSTLALARTLYPDDVELIRDHARLRVLERDLAGATADLDLAAGLAPNDPDVARQLGELLLHEHQYSRAAAAYERASRLAPAEPQDHVMLAQAYLALDRKVLARQQVDLALQLSPLDPEANDLSAVLTRQASLMPARTTGEWLELAAYVLVLAVILVVSNRVKRILRRHPAYYYFTRYVVPGFVLLNLVTHFIKPWLGRWVDPVVFEASSEAVLILGLGVAFVVVGHAERRRLPELADQVVLAIGAHPDDVELGAAGFLMKLKESGARVYNLTLTRGEKGVNGNGRRDLETGRAAAFMELDGWWVLDFPDGELPDRILAVKAIIEEKIKETGATLVLTHTDVDIHGDHRAVHAATLEAARRVPTVLCYEDVSTVDSFQPNFYVDITNYIEDHLRVVSFHHSQEHRTYMDPEVIKGRAAHRGLQIGASYAQAFKTLYLVR